MPCSPETCRHSAKNFLRRRLIFVSFARLLCTLAFGRRNLKLSKHPVDRSYTCPFDTSSQLQLSWLAYDLIVHDFVPERNFFVDIYHAHPFLELLYVESGKGQLLVEGAPPEPMEEGSVLFVNAGVSHKLQGDLTDMPQTYLTAFTLQPREQIDKISREWAEDEKQVVDAVLQAPFLIVQDDGSCGQEIKNIIASASTRKLGELVIIKNHLSNLVMHAFQQFTRFPARDDFDDILTGIPSLSTSRILGYIQNHFTENISVNSMAEQLHYSPRQCQRVIRHNLGVCFSDLVTDLRLTYGKQLLRTTDDSVEKIAELAGFTSSKSFSHLLRERDGVTPYRYRKENSKR